MKRAFYIIGLSGEKTPPPIWETLEDLEGIHFCRHILGHGIPRHNNQELEFHELLKWTILLMEEILHHLTCIKPCLYWDIYHINWLAGFFFHQQYGSRLKLETDFRISVRSEIPCERIRFLKLWNCPGAKNIHRSILTRMKHHMNQDQRRRTSNQDEAEGSFLVAKTKTLLGFAFHKEIWLESHLINPIFL